MTVHRMFSTASLSLIAGAAFMLASPLPAVAAKRTNAIHAIDVAEKASRTEVTIVASARPTFTVFKLTHPTRLYIDIVDADLSALKPKMLVRNGVIADISVSQATQAGRGSIGRIALAFDRDASYDIETRGSKLVVLVDGEGRDRPDLRLAAAQAEAAKLERAVKRERKLLADLRAARTKEEKLKRAAQTERAQQQILTRRVAAARAQAERLGLQAKTELDRITAQLKTLSQRKKLAKDKVAALARAVAAEKERKIAAAAERKKLEQLRAAIQRATEVDRNRLAAVRAATQRAQAEARAATEAAKAAHAQRLTQARIADAKARGQHRKLSKLKAELARRDRALAKAQDQLAKRRKSVQEARLAEAQAATRLRAAVKARTVLEKERQTLGDRRLAKEKARMKALEEASARKIRLAASNANERAQRDLARLEIQLLDQRRAVKAAKQRAEVEQARIAMLQSQLESEREQLANIRKLRKSEERRVAKLRLDAKRYETEAAAAQKRAAEYARQLKAKATSKKAHKVADAQIAALKAKLAKERAAADKARRQAAAADAKSLKAQRERTEAQAQRLAADKQRQAAEARRVKAEAQRLAAEKRSNQIAAKAEAQRVAAERSQKRAAKAEAQRVAAEERARTAAATAASKKPPTSKVTDVTFRDLATGGGEVTIALDKSTPYKVISHNQRRIELKLFGSKLPASLERSLDASEFEGPIRLISTFRSKTEPGVIRVVIDLREDARHELKTVGHNVVWAFAKKMPTNRAVAKAPVAPMPPVKRRVKGRRTPPGVTGYPGAVGAEGGSTASSGGGSGRYMKNRSNRRGGKRYRGKRINVTIKDADIRNVLTFLAKEGGVNIVANEKVGGKVTFHLENVPWDLALDMILKTQGYDYVLEAGVYRVAPAKDIREEFEAEVKKKQALRELKPLVVRFISVNYANLKDLEKHIKSVLSKHGSVTVDQATSTVLVKDVEEHVQAAEEIVRRLDVQLPQVLIEARIVEATTSFSSEFGIQWGGDFAMAPAFGNPTGLAFPSIIGLSGGADDAAAPTEGLLTSNPNFAVNLPAAVGAGAGGALGLTLGSIGGAANLNLRLSAAESRGQVKIVSAPKILTLDGNKALIRQGVAIPVPVVSANGVNTQFFDASLKLEVLTNTSPDGNIRLDIDISKNEPDFGQTSSNGAPTIQKKEANTSLLVRDGETTVIGGIFTRNSGFNESGVPVLSKIPILGWFFKNHRESDNRSELLIFITPRVLNRRASVVGQGQFTTGTRVDGAQP